MTHLETQFRSMFHLYYYSSSIPRFVLDFSLEKYAQQTKQNY